MANGLKAQLEAELAAHLQVPAGDRGYVPARVGAGQRADILGSHAQALALFEEALAAKGDDPEARYEQGCQLLLRGQFAPGWPGYHFLYKKPQFLAEKALSLPMWGGPGQSGDSIVLYSDQGYGDAIQFMRFAPQVRSSFRRILLKATWDLQRLFSAPMLIDEFLEDMGYRERYPGGIKTVGAEYCAPLSSLPGYFKADDGNMPVPTPCVATPRDIEFYRGRLQVGGRPLVGIAWRGKDATPRNPVRSFTSTEFLPLIHIPEIRLVLFQWGANPDETEQFERAGGINLGTEIRDRGWDYSMTAAALTHMSLVVTCDSVIAHLAASLGIKTWVALPVASEWRWQLERRDSPWYRTVRLFRQREFGVWGPVIAEIADAIRRGEWRD